MLYIFLTANHGEIELVRKSHKSNCTWICRLHSKLYTKPKKYSSLSVLGSHFLLLYDTFPKSLDPTGQNIHTFSHDIFTNHDGVFNKSHPSPQICSKGWDVLKKDLYSPSSVGRASLMIRSELDPDSTTLDLKISSSSSLEYVRQEVVPLFLSVYLC